MCVLVVDDGKLDLNECLHKDLCASVLLQKRMPLAGGATAKKNPKSALQYNRMLEFTLNSERMGKN